jgi:hypothetical protein
LYKQTLNGLFTRKIILPSYSRHPKLDTFLSGSIDDYVHCGLTTKIRNFYIFISIVVRQHLLPKNHFPRKQTLMHKQGSTCGVHNVFGCACFL